MSLQPDTSLVSKDILIAIRLTAENLAKFRNGANPVLKSANSQSNFRRINHTWELISGNEQAIADDYQMITHLRKSEILPDSNHLLGDNLFISEGCEIYNSTFDTRKGPIYIGKCVEIMPGCHIQGPAAICDHATLKMGSLIYKGTTIGPWCKAGGEISNSIFTGYSSKAHDGFLGDSVIGEWCNLGAGTTTSNLKNNYEQVKQWSYTEKRFVKTGLQFCGLVMGDHCKTGISTMFNSGTTTGVCSNIFGIGYHRNFIPSFVWGGTAGFRPHKLTEAIETAKAVYKRRNLDFDNTEEQIFTKVFEITANDRTL
jgi:UDP-N-acetylglucosamine diphosphorylase/glucosamine-1-phosphate N-acetyltransferase